MRIESNFKDYYDYVAKYGVDNNVVFNRVRKKDEGIIDQRLYSKNWQGMLNQYHVGFDYCNATAIYIGFAGEIYPLIIRKHSTYLDGYPEKPDLYVFDPEWTDSSRIWFDCTGEKRRAFFDTQKNIFKDYLFRTYGPQWVVVFNYYPDSKGSAIVFKNACMKDYQLDKVLSAQHAYENMYRYLCNNHEEKPVPEMKNDIKIEQHGFDLKTSFRKAKES
jgi:hypothetical protein